jgi:putative tryptophan/tyrosine transport system substrate-binding protein
VAIGIGRRQFISALGGATVVWPLAVRAQQHGRIPLITIWMARAEDAEGRRHTAAFRDGLQALGWIDGRNIRTDYRWVPGVVERVQSTAKEVAAQQPDLIVAETTPAVAALRHESPAVPIVFVNVSDPIGSGFVASLAHPGGAITGFMSNEPTLGGKWPELIKEIAPGITHIGFLFNPNTSPHAEAFMRQAETAALAIGIRLSAAPFQSDADIESAIVALSREPGGGLIVLPEPSTNVRSAIIIELATRYRLPALFAFRYQATGGGLISYGVDLADSFRDAASYVDRILKGETPAALPVQAPTKFALVVNLKTAKALGLDVPTSMLLRATEVIE